MCCSSQDFFVYILMSFVSEFEQMPGIQMTKMYLFIIFNILTANVLLDWLLISEWAMIIGVKMKSNPDQWRRNLKKDKECSMLVERIKICTLWCFF